MPPLKHILIGSGGVMAPTSEELLLGLLLLSHLGTVYLLLDCRGHIPHAAEATAAIGTNMREMVDDWADKSGEWSNIMNDIADSLDRIDGGLARGAGDSSGTTPIPFGAEMSPLGLLLGLMSAKHGAAPIQERAQEGTIYAESQNDTKTPSDYIDSTEETPSESQD
jgi:hypothetical protein